MLMLSTHGIASATDDKLPQTAYRVTTLHPARGPNPPNLLTSSSATAVCLIVNTFSASIDCAQRTDRQTDRLQCDSTVA